MADSKLQPLLDAAEKATLFQRIKQWLSKTPNAPQFRYQFIVPGVCGGCHRRTSAVNWGGTRFAGMVCSCGWMNIFEAKLENKPC